MAESFRTVAHRDLTSVEVGELRQLFDREYLANEGEWDPEQPYGYAPADTHVLGYQDGALMGHVGFQRREVSVGRRQFTVAGTGGVLVAPEARGDGFGARLMAVAQHCMRDTAGIDFGYLGCREAVVPFYERTGWQRIAATERCESWRSEGDTVVSTDSPILIYALHGQGWPDGDIDLHGKPW